MTIQPRLLADFAATPTRRERAAVRAHWHAAQPSMFEPEHRDDDEPVPCPVCAGPHAEPDCPHGTAPTLELHSAFGIAAPAPIIAEQPTPEALASRLDRWGRCAGTARPPDAAGRCAVCAATVRTRTDGNTQAHRYHEEETP